MIVQAPNRISAVASHEYVFCLWAEDEVFEWAVRLEKTPMFLRLEYIECDFWRHNAQVEPGRCHVDGAFFGALEDELRDDLLGPCRPGFSPASDYDVVWSEVEVVPSC